MFSVQVGIFASSQAPGTAVRHLFLDRSRAFLRQEQLLGDLKVRVRPFRVAPQTDGPTRRAFP